MGDASWEAIRVISKSFFSAKAFLLVAAKIYIFSVADVEHSRKT
jgi:hypothetical protein